MVAPIETEGLAWDSGVFAIRGNGTAHGRLAEPAERIATVEQAACLARIAGLAGQRSPLDEILQAAVENLAEVLRADLVRAVEILPASGGRRVRAVAGREIDDLLWASPGPTEGPLAYHDGFAGSPARPWLSAPIHACGAQFGVIEVSGIGTGAARTVEAALLRNAAAVLGLVVALRRADSELQAVKERSEILREEMGHRLKNGLQFVAGALYVQAAASLDGRLTEQLRKASDRVAAVARAYSHLDYRSEQAETDLGPYLRALCAGTRAVLADCDLQAEGGDGLMVPTDRAVPIALVVNELVTNAAKHGGDGAGHCRVRVRTSLSGDGAIRVSVQDEGAGMPPDSELPANPGGGLGLRIVRTLVRQLGADLTRTPRETGTTWVLTLPPGVGSSETVSRRS